MAIIGADELTEVPSFSIAEQTGDKRTLILTQRALPYRPIEFSGEQRSELTAYAGNPIKTLQVFGAEEEPSEINGFWKDRFLGQVNQDSPAYYTDQTGGKFLLITAADLAEVADDIRRKGQEVVVQWGRKVRRGIVKRFTERWHNIHDVEWVMRFEWTSQNDPPAQVVIAQDSDYANTLGRLQADVQGVLNTINNLVASANIVADTAKIYIDRVNVLADLVQECFDTVSGAISTGLGVLDQARRLTGILTDIADGATNLMGYINAVPAIVLAVIPFLDAQAEESSGIDEDEIKEGPSLAVEAYNRQMLILLRNMLFLACRERFNILKQVNPNIIAVFTARQDVDLRQISTIYYGTQDEWRSLMVFNNLTSSDLDAGDTVFIPALTQSLDGT